MKQPVRVACLGMGWWSDVLADAMKRSGKFEMVGCYTRSTEKRLAFSKKYGCRAVDSYEQLLGDKSIEAIVNTTPNSVHLETTRAAAQAGKHVFLDKPIANTVADGLAITLTDNCQLIRVCANRSTARALAARVPLSHRKESGRQNCLRDGGRRSHRSG